MPTQDNRLTKARRAVLKTAKAMATAGFATGSSGNVSLRFHQHYLITASGVPYDRLVAAQIIEIDTDGKAFSGRGEPSSEWRMHAAIYAQRDDVRAIVHTHSPLATAAAIVLPALPVLHDEGRILFGAEVPVSEHHPPGTWDLAHAVAEALGSSRGVLVARHGVVGVGATLDEAFENAVKIEEIARLSLFARQFESVRRKEEA